MTTSQTGLVKARIAPVMSDGSDSPFTYAISGSYVVECMFNPTDYTIKKKNKYTKGGYSGHNYLVEYETGKVEPRQLTLGALWFDTSETGEDVRQYTDTLFEYVELQTAIPDVNFNTYTASLSPPPLASFEWGNFRFLGAITSVKVDFVYFKPDGTPIRAKATVSFKEFRHRKAYPNQNPTSGGEATNRIWRINRGDRLDLIAAKVYGDASLWRPIAAHNNITDPWALQPGRTLHIPARWTI